MDPAGRIAKRALVACWIMSVLALLAYSPVALIMGTFASDSGTSAAMTAAYLIMLSPILFLMCPIVAQVLYSKRRFKASRIFSYIAVSLVVLLITVFVLTIYTNVRG